jgi:hypothetical protein
MIKQGNYLGSAARVSLILIYGALAFLIADHLGQTVPDRPGVLPASATEDSGQEIRIKFNLSASRPIEIWSVVIDGAEIGGDSMTEHGWSAEIDLKARPDQRLVIDVIPSESLTDSPLAVHLKASSNNRSWEQTFWAPDELVESVALEPLWEAWEVAP